VASPRSLGSAAATNAELREITMRSLSLILAGFASLGELGIAAYDLAQVNDKVRAVGSDVARGSVGVGLYLCIAGFLVCMFASFGFSARFKAT
jgi:hypothetical protein